MEQVRKDFIYLLSCFLNGETPENRHYDFEKIYNLADINDVAAIIAFLIKNVKAEAQLSDTTLQYYKKSMAQAISSYEEKSRAYEFIKSIFEYNNICYIAIKGIIIREKYPIKEFRTSGDIDFIVKVDDIDKIYEILKDKNDVTIHSYNAGVIVFEMCNCLVEIHDSADVKRKYFDNIFELTDTKEEHKLEEYNHLLYVLCHLLKHLSYRGAGVRMLMDIDVMIRSFNDFDENKFLQMCDSAGVLKSAEVLLSLSKLWFNTPVESRYDLNEDKELLEKLTSVLIDGGSFGYEMNYIPVKYLKNAVDGDGGISLAGKVKIFFSMAFPDKEYLKKCYRYYEKNNALYPVAVCNRLYDGVFKKRKSAAGAINQIINNPKSILLQKELAKELNIE